ncbi:skin secretory protein xP2-like [Falco rusticolus]|uniref:skin secretory protein xP2-like n=1 Tax=Falco rusticolus TaxID=120794 RepID=UPI0018866CB4|nr:skin secretory protein xP2-like [Falco rusticolus]
MAGLAARACAPVPFYRRAPPCRRAAVAAAGAGLRLSAQPHHGDRDAWRRRHGGPAAIGVSAGARPRPLPSVPPGGGRRVRPPGPGGLTAPRDGRPTHSSRAGPGGAEPARQAAAGRLSGPGPAPAWAPSRGCVTGARQRLVPQTPVPCPAGLPRPCCRAAAPCAHHRQRGCPCVSGPPAPKAGGLPAGPPRGNLLTSFSSNAGFRDPRLHSSRIAHRSSTALCGALRTLHPAVRECPCEDGGQQQSPFPC